MNGDDSVKLESEAEPEGPIFCFMDPPMNIAQRQTMMEDEVVAGWSSSKTDDDYERNCHCVQIQKNIPNM